MLIKKRASDPDQRRVEPRIHGLVPGLMRFMGCFAYLPANSRTKLLKTGLKIDCLSK